MKKINDNEYDICGKRYIKKIKRCKVNQKVNDIYDLMCEIHQRGYNLYNYYENCGYIIKDRKRNFYLLEEAKKIVKDAIDRFNQLENEAVNSSEFRKIILLDDFYIYYRPRLFNYDMVLKYKDGSNDCVEIFEDISAGDLISKIIYNFLIDKRYKDELDKKYTAFNVDIHPFIISAREYNDWLLELKIKMYLRVAIKSECLELSKLLGKKFLPSLDKKHDKSYYIDVDTISSENYDLILRSGYQILHRPYFAMMSSTHKKITLNPHTKYGVDAARSDTPSISFNDYLELFEENT